MDLQSCLPMEMLRDEPRENVSFLTIKAYLDFVLAIVLFILSSPIVLIVAILVKLTSRGPAFYSQIRVGKDGQNFTIYKLRTMTYDCERSSGIRWATDRDPRVTLIGRFLRASKIDELPQLWNVIRGDMSLVGPRPERPEFVHTLKRAIPNYAERLRVRPGLTGLAQIQLPADSGLETVRRKLLYDLYYIDHLGIRLELQILLGTIGYVLRVPFRVTRMVLRVPSREKVETAHHFKPSEPALSQVQTA